MPNILTIPREIRDEIYKWGLLDTLSSAKSRILQRDRKRVEYDSEDPDTHYGEEAVRYPAHTSLPAIHPLLQTSRQLRAELLDRVERMGPLRYKLDLTNREDKDKLYPTWISVPLISKKVDIVDVQLRVRGKKTSSVCSFVSDEGREYEGDVFFGGLALLQRFLERGVHFLSKKKGEKISVGLLAINIDTPENVSEEEAVTGADEAADHLDEWMRGITDIGSDLEAEEREDKQFRFLAGKIDRLSLSVKGNLRREWDLKEMLAKRDELKASEEEAAAAAAAADARTRNYGLSYVWYSLSGRQDQELLDIESLTESSN